MLATMTIDRSNYMKEQYITYPDPIIGPKGVSSYKLWRAHGALTSRSVGGETSHEASAGSLRAWLGSDATRYFVGVFSTLLDPSCLLQLVCTRRVAST